MQKEEISTIVREVLKEKGLMDSRVNKPPSQRIKRPRPTPAVLNVFHAGVRKLAQALEQVEKIEKIAARSSVFTVDSARSWVCGADVKEKAGTRCILDSVKPEGLEKALQKADILVLPTFCFKTAAKVARLISDDQESSIVLAALTQAKPVLATRDGFGLCEVLINEGIRNEIGEILTKLESFGMVFCETEQLCEVFKRIIIDKLPAETESGKKVTEKPSPAGLKLVTAKDIQMAVDNQQQYIQVAPGAIVTPLARDQAQEYSIQIKKSGA